MFDTVLDSFHRAVKEACLGCPQISDVSQTCLFVTCAWMFVLLTWWWSNTVTGSMPDYVSIEKNVIKYFPSPCACVCQRRTPPNPCGLSHLKWTSNFLWLTFSGSEKKRGVWLGAPCTLGCVCMWYLQAGGGPSCPSIDPQLVPVWGVGVRAVGFPFSNTHIRKIEEGDEKKGRCWET